MDRGQLLFTLIILAASSLYLIPIQPVSAWTPTFVRPPTPNCRSTFTVTATNTLTFNVTAREQLTVTLTVTGLPDGATMTPPLPRTGNPVSSIFSWTPSGSQVGTYTITLKASLLPPNQHFYSTCKIYIRVTTFVIPEFPLGTLLAALLPIAALVVYMRKGLPLK